MTRATTIQYDTAAKLNSQSEKIERSRLDALRKIIADAYSEVTGLTMSDPPELWRYAFSRIEHSKVDLTKEPSAWAIAEYLRRIDPQFSMDAKAHELLVATIGKSTLRVTAQNLANRVLDDDELTKHLAKLLKLHKRGPIARSAYDQARFDDDTTKRILFQHWIEYPRGKRWAFASLCFFSDRAIAKMVYRLRKKEWLPLHQIEAETDRIKKIYRRLGLVVAKPRIIKDIVCKFEEVQYIPFKSAVWTG